MNNELDFIGNKCPQRTNTGGPGAGHKFKPTDLPKGWEKFVVEMASEGACLKEIRAALKVMPNSKCLSEYVFRRLYDEHDEFAEVIDQAYIQFQAFWLKQGRVNLHNKEFNTGLYIFNMSNRMNWRQRNDTTSDDKPINPESPAVSHLATIVAKIATGGSGNDTQGTDQV